MRAPRWTRWLLRRAAPRERADDVLGDLEEAHRSRRERHGAAIAWVVTALEALDVALALVRQRASARATLSLLDFKLGVRMLVKHPGLTVVGVIAISFGIGLGVVVFQLMSDLYNPDLGLPGSDRVVELEQGEDRQVLHDFVTWRQELGSVEDVSAYATSRRNLITDDRGSAPVTIGVINASGFRVAGVPPLLGRTLIDADEDPGAPTVIVLGHDVWRGLLGADPDVVGRTVRLGADPATVVGVMPEGFRFPMSHDAWMPLRLNPLDYPRGQAPTLDVFGALAPGASLGEAQAELTALGLRAAADFSATNGRRRPVVRPYRGGILHGSERLMLGAYSFMAVLPSLILALVCANIALMVFARTAARESEIAVRSALGAGRGRIVTQLFVESLVLASVAGVVGLIAADAVLGALVRLMFQVAGAGPYWFHDGLTVSTVGYAALFTLIGALAVGLVPALLVTRGGLRARLGSATAGGGGLRMGRLWSGVIVTQVAVTISLVPFMGLALRIGAPAFWPAQGLEAGAYLAATLEFDREPSSAAEPLPHPPDRARVLHARYRELEERLSTRPDVRGVTFARNLPGTSHGSLTIEVEGLDESDVRTSTGRVEPDFFDVLEVPVLSGRTFDARDLDAGGRVAVVNEGFVRRFLSGKSPVGRRVRFPVPTTPDGIARSPDEIRWSEWHEIVGLVRDRSILVGFDAAEDDGIERLYLPLAPGSATQVGMVVHVAGDPEALLPRVRAIAADVEPTLHLVGLEPLDDRIAAQVRLMATAIWTVVLGGALALLLSNGGIYSAMSFAVSRRTREIGVRVALGAGRRRIVTAILGRSMVQVASGLFGGGLLLYLIMRYQSGEGLLLWDTGEGNGVTLAEALASVGAYGTFMAVVCALACLVPTRRALSIEPTEALRADG